MVKKIRVCFLTPIHFSSQTGGAEYQISILIEALEKTKKYEIFYVCQKADENFLPDGYQICLIKSARMPGSLFSFLAANPIYATLKKIKPSIIYQRVGGIYTGVGAYYAKKNNAKFIWQVSSDNNLVFQWENNFKETFLKLIERMYLNYGIKNATAIIAQTKFQAEVLKKKFSIECQGIISNGHPLPEAPLIKTNPIKILWISNLKPLKRPEIFVRLARRFCGRDNVRFIMIGRQGWGKWFQKLMKEIKTLPNLNYLGELSQEQVNRHLSNGHILVNTSQYEGFPNTFVQAWIRKVPVVSLAVDPDQILVRKKIGFKSESFEQLCKDVATLINDRTMRETMGKYARCHALENHTIEKMVTHTIQFLNPPK